MQQRTARLGMRLVIASMFVGTVGCGRGVHSQPRPPRPPSHQQVVTELLADYSARWSQGDAAGIAALWTPDGDLVTLAGGMFRGRPAIQGFFTESVTNKPGSQFESIVDGVRTVGPDLVIVDGRWRVTSAKRMEKGVFTAVLVQDNDAWRFLALRTSLTSGGHTRGIGRIGDFPDIAE